MKIGSFATFMHIVIKTMCMMDLFNIPLCGKKLWYMYFLLYFLVDKMLHRPPSGSPRPGSLLMFPPLFIHFLHFFFFSFVLIITQISNQIAMRKSIRDVVDVQSLGSRHQMKMLHYWIFYIRIIAHATLRNSHTALSIRHAAPSNCSYYEVLNNQYAGLNHLHAALSN